jgi:hypothetical protein
MQQAPPLRQSKQSGPAHRRFSPLVPQTIRRSMRNIVQDRVLNGVADQRQTCSMIAPGSKADTQQKLACLPGKVNVALPAEAVQTCH